MNCAYHRDQPVHGVCSTCGRPICEHCLVDLNGHAHCKACLETRMRRPDREVNSFVRFVLSAAPGFGHLYMGLFQRGLQLMIITVGGAILLGMLMPPLLGFYIPASIFFSIFDAREAHLRMGQGLEVEDKGFVDPQKLQMQWHPRYIGYALIVIGAVAVFNTVVTDLLYVLFPVVHYKLVASIRGLAMGGLAIGAGLWMLRRNSNDFTR